MQFTVFASLGANTCTPTEATWEQLCQYLGNPPEYAQKADAPLIKFAAFGTTLTNKGSLRHDANVLAVTGVEGDHDAETMSPEEAYQRLQAAGIQAAIYTSASNAPGKPRWRVLAPTSQAYAPEAHRELAARLNGVLGGVLSNESFTLSQSYYIGRVRGVPYVAYATTGQPIDTLPLQPLYPAFKSEHTGDFTLSAAPSPEWRGPEDDSDLIRRALNSRSVAGAFGNRATFADLWEGNHDALSKAFPDDKEAYNASQADAALVAHLAFWTGRHGERIERLMRQSALRREKWEREDYLPRTIAKILAAPGDVLTDKLPEPPSVPQAASGAPEMAAVTGSTFLSADGQRGLFNGCVYVQDQHRVLVPGGNLLKPEQFRAAFGGYTFAMDAVNERTSRNAWEAFTESQVLRAPRADTICFKPSEPPAALLRVEGRIQANTWWPADVPRQVGDPNPFLDHVRRMLPDERDQAILLSYMAACVQHKGVKFQWAPVLQGAEGNGKTQMSRCVAAAVGQHYTHWVRAKNIATNFNSFLANKVLLAVEEMYNQEHSADVIEALKDIIAGGSGMGIEKKGVDQISMEICVNLMLNTNYKASVRKTPDNARRYCLFYTAQQTYADIVRDGMGGDYFPRLVHWYKHQQGYAIVNELLHTYPITPEFDPTGAAHRAPHTSSTDAAIVESMGSVEQQIAEVIAQDTPGFMGGWVSTHMLDRLISETLRMGSRLSLSKRREMLAAMGYVLHPGLVDGRPNNPVQPDGRKPQLFVLANSPAAHIRGAAEIARAYTAAQTISPLNMKA